MQNTCPIFKSFLPGIFLFALSCLLPFMGVSQVNRMEMRQFTITDGLPENGVLCMLQDERGFIWAGTQNGLTRYNGYEWTVFQENPAEAFSIKGKYVAALLETGEGDLWIGTDQGLNFFDRSLNRFYYYEVDTIRRPYRTTQLPWLVHSLFEDRQGFLWLVAGEENQLYRWSPATKTVRPVRQDAGDPSSIGFDRIGKPELIWGNAAICQEESGTIWLGSGDGRGLVHFDHQTDRFTTIQDQLPSDTIHVLFIDQEQLLWIGTEKGLVRYNPTDRTFRYFAGAEEERPIYDIKEDSRGFLWVSRPFLLERFHKRTGTFKEYRSFTDFQKTYRPNRFVTRGSPALKWIGEKKSGSIFFFLSNTPTHIYAYLPETDELVSINPQFDNKTFEWQRRELLTGLIDRSGLLWLSLYWDNGLLREEKTPYNFSSFGSNTASSIRSINHDVGGGFTEDRNGNIWITGVGKEGVSRYDPYTDQLQDFPSRQKIGSHAMTDDQGNIWVVGTSGALKIDPGRHSSGAVNLALGKPVLVSSSEPGPDMFSKDFITDGDHKSRWNSDFDPDQWVLIDLQSDYLVERVVLHWYPTMARIFQVQLSVDGKSWRNVFRETEGGLNSTEDIPVSGRARYVKLLCIESTNAWGYSLFEIEVYGAHPVAQHYFPIPGDTTARNIISHFTRAVQDTAKNIWFTNGQGISLYEPGKDRFFHIPIINLEGKKNGIFDITSDSKGKFWLMPWWSGAGGGGAFLFDPNTTTQRQYTHRNEDSISLSDDRVWIIRADQLGDIWIGTMNGLNYYRPEKDNFKRYLEEIVVASFFQDSRGRYWVGSWLNGLILLDKDKGPIRQYTVENGLASNSVTTIQEDKQGKIWVGTNNGLSRLDTDTGISQSFSTSDGLLQPPVYSNSFRDSRGRLYFGGHYGFTVVDPENVVLDTAIPPIAITGFRLSNEQVRPNETGSPLQQAIEETSTLSLKHDQNIITLEYAVLDYQQPEKNRYQVMMEGIDDNWIDVGNQRTMHYAGLPPGKYTFRVKGSNAYGIWNETGAAVNIRILQPWWWSLGAKISYLLLVIGLFYAFYRRRTAEQAKKLAAAQQLNERLQQVDKLKDQFLANTSHELRTPLQGIIGLSESWSAKAQSEELRDDMSLITSSGKRLANLVNDILDFSKLKNYDIELLRRPVNLRVLVDIVLRNNAPLVKGKEVALINDIPTDLPAVDADENRLQQILYNLIGNAIKFTEKGYVKLAAVEVDDHIQVSVEDTGAGIPDNKREAIFEEFEQADGSTSRQFAGTGLGLSISKKLVELHGGRMWVTSTHVEDFADKADRSTGSTFFFTLPVSQGKPATLRLEHTALRRAALSTNDSKEAILPAAGDPSIHILVVDDEPINQQVLKHHLASQNFQLTQAMNGEEAISLIGTRSDFDLVLLDVMMPRMSGYEVCQEIRKTHLPSELPVIMITAKNQLQDVVQGLSVGANDYLPKPFHKEELIARIKTQLDLHHIFAVAGRFVPNEFLHALNKDRITEVALGDYTEREVTVLFTDIRDYTGLAESMTPEENFRFVNAFHGRMGPVILKHKGFVNQYLGDAIMAIFPHSPEDALQAAVEMLQVLSTYNSQRRQDGRQIIRMGIGLHTGPLIMGIIGDQNRMDAATIADTVNTASRIENLTKYYGTAILLSEHSHQRIANRDRFDFRYLGKIRAKGKQEVVGLYECYSGDSAAVIAHKAATILEFEKGLQQFFDREFPQAVSTFDKILKTNPDDQTARLFINKSSEYTIHGVPGDWTGIEVMTSK